MKEIDERTDCELVCSTHTPAVHNKNTETGEACRVFVLQPPSALKPLSEVGRSQKRMRIHEGLGNTLNHWVCWGGGAACRHQY